MYFFENALRTTPRYLNPPGYVTVPEFRKRPRPPTCTDLRQLGRSRRHQPHRRRHAGEGRRRRGWIEESGSTRLNLNLTIGDMPNWKVGKNTTLFAEEVIPGCAPGRRSSRSMTTTLLTAAGRAHVRAARLRRQRHRHRGAGGGRPRRHRSCSSTARARSTAGPSPNRGPSGSGAHPSPPGLRRLGRLDGLHEVHDLVLHYVELFDQLGLRATSTWWASRWAA